MLHPRLTPYGSTRSYWLVELGDYGAWGDLACTTRWGSGACGMYEASWTMPLPPDFEHPAVRRGTVVELMDGPWRVGSSLVLAAPERGESFGDPWSFTATGVGREVEGENSYYALDVAGITTSIPSTAVDAAVTYRGLPWVGRDSSVPTAQVGATADTDALTSIGSLLSTAADSLGKRWGVGPDNRAYFWSDPIAPTWHVTPGSVELGTSDDDYASVVFVRFISSVTGVLTTVGSENAQATARFGRKEYPVDLTALGAISNAQAQAYADGILAKSKGRLAWTNGFSLTSNELLSAGGVPADLSLVEAGQMVRVHGIYSDLLESNGQTWLDLILGEVKYEDGAATIDLSPLGLTPHNLADVTEAVTGLAA